VPEQLFDLIMTPIMFTLLFTFVFGGALAGSTGAYLQFFLPGILVQTVVFNAVYSGMGLSTDLGKGLFDRFRSLPIWSLAPFAGLMVGDILRHLIAGGIILTIGLILGYRPRPASPASSPPSRCCSPSVSAWAGSSSCWGFWSARRRR
jgi:ABC-2 type transport system permease protein